MKQNPQSWRTLHGHRVLNTIEQELQQVITTEINNGHTIHVCIGTDSQVKQAHTSFATVIVIVRKGAGAFMYIQQCNDPIKMSIKQAMMKEVDKSVTIAYQLSETLQQLQVPMEVHVDINKNEAFKSNAALQDATGYVKGMGFAFKAKPLAFASSCCANKIVQKK
jgi:uncharacterized protein